MSSALRVSVGADGVSIWSPEIFGPSEPHRVRDFLSRAFAVQEVQGVELRRATSFGRIRYSSVANPAPIWKKLSRALSAPHPAQVQESARPVDARLVYLDAPGAAPVRISRIGNVLSTWRVRHQGESTLQLSHPALRNRRDVVYRLEEELAAILGVENFSASALTAGVSIRFDKSATTAERLARELERAWPRLLTGLDGPPSQTRLAVAAGLMGLAFTGQYLAPAVRPLALAGVTLYSFPNVVNTGKELTRGQIGISALYATGLGFMLVSGLPFTASVMATLMQFWPHLARRKIIRSQRRLFAAQRRRPAWARLLGAEGLELEVGVDELRKDDLVVVRQGEIVPVDGVVHDGSAAVVDAPPFGGDRLAQRSPGDSVVTGAFVRAGGLTIRVERAGAQTSASYVASLLPHTTLVGLPSSLEAERIANRNAKPALALSALNLWLTGALAPSQAVIRPDYATGPRLSAQLSALQGIAHGLQQGVLFRNPAALDRLAVADVYVIDDGVSSVMLTGESVSRRLVAALRAQNEKARIVYFTRGARAESRALARALGIDAAHSGLSQAAKLELLRGLGRKTVWIGDGSDLRARELIAASAVSVSVAPLGHAREDAADILLPHDGLAHGLAGLPELIGMGRAHAGRLARDYRTLYATNLLGVAGGFLASFSTLQVGLLSNFGTGVIYARHARALNRLASAAEQQRASHQSSATR
jgi:cation transport ATPase